APPALLRFRAVPADALARFRPALFDGLALAEPGPGPGPAQKNPPCSSSRRCSRPPDRRTKRFLILTTESVNRAIDFTREFRPDQADCSRKGFSFDSQNRAETGPKPCASERE